MICKDCVLAADNIYLGGTTYLDEAIRLHGACEGCDCQHDWQSQLDGRSLR